MLFVLFFVFSEWDHVKDVQVRDRAAGRPQTSQAQSVWERHRHGNHVSRRFLVGFFRSLGFLRPNREKKFTLYGLICGSDQLVTEGNMILQCLHVHTLISVFRRTEVPNLFSLVLNATFKDETPNLEATLLTCANMEGHTKRSLRCSCLPCGQAVPFFFCDESSPDLHFSATLFHS